MGKVDKIQIQKNDDKINLKAIVTGENFDDKRHQLKVEIKAVTFHQIEIREVNNKYFTRIIFDI